MFVNFRTKTERKVYCNVPLYTDIPSYCSYWGETVYFVTFPEAAIESCSRENTCGKSSKLKAVRIIKDFDY